MIFDFYGSRAFTVPGLNGSSETHWQSLWETACPEITRITQPYWDIPSLPTWSNQIITALSASSRPAVMIAHSFGCLATIHASLDKKIPIAGAFLVAPADPEKFGLITELSIGPLPFPSVLIASSNDPWMQVNRARDWAVIWGSEFIDAGALGHINADSDLGLWETGIGLLQRFLDRLLIDGIVATPQETSQ
jgi:predicted alpha/beta hydrolase family esterase